jgi:hypothetical protein
MAARDFWGDLQQATDLRTPLAILREQASMLGPKTSNLVEARVVTQVLGDRFVHHFELVVPPLDNYRYELFTIQHGIDLYPVKELREDPEMRDEAELTEWLRQRLSSPETRRIVSNLVAQARS